MGAFLYLRARRWRKEERDAPVKCAHSRVVRFSGAVRQSEWCQDCGAFRDAETDGAFPDNAWVYPRRPPENIAQPPPPPSSRHVPDPGKQALAILQRGENCNWYSIEHTNEMHEAFDCLEIYWRTEVEQPEKNEFQYGRGPFELKAGFRVRWHVAGACTSYVEAVGLDLMSTILEARELADRHVARAQVGEDMDWKHPRLEAWKSGGIKRKYSFHGLDLEEWRVSLEYPGGYAYGNHENLDQAVEDALGKAPS